MQAQRSCSARSNIKMFLVVLLAAVLVTACTSKAAKALEKVELGQRYLTELNYTEAVVSFTEAIGLDPENIPAYIGRAQAYVSLRDYEQAKQDYTIAIEKTAELPYTQAQAYIGRAEVYELTQELTRAAEDCDAALQLLDAGTIAEKQAVENDLITTLQIKALRLHAALCVKLGWTEKALADYEKLEALGEDMSAERKALENAGIDLGNAYSGEWMTVSEEDLWMKVGVAVQCGSKELELVIDGGYSDASAEQLSFSAQMGMSMDLMMLYGGAENMRTEQQQMQEKAEKLYQQQLENLQNGIMNSAVEEELTALFNPYETIATNWAQNDWKSAFSIKTVLSEPVSRIEKEGDLLVIYVPTGTHLVSDTAVFTTADGKVQTRDMLQYLEYTGSKVDTAKPVYERENNSAASVEDVMMMNMKIEYREDTRG